VLGVLYLGEHWWKEKEIDELGIELSASAFQQHLACDVDRLGIAIASAMRERVEGVGDRNDARRERNASSFEAARIPLTIPPLVM
jgi:hypothetical protein